MVIDEDYTPLLSSTSAQEMGLITVQHESILNVNETVVKTDCQGLTMEEVTASYSDVFKGLGCMEGALHLEVDATVTPAVLPPRCVPITLPTSSKPGRRPRGRRTRPRRHGTTTASLCAKI